MTPTTRALLLFGLLTAGTLAAFILPATAPAGTYRAAGRAAPPIDHGAYDRLLRQYVNDQGLVDYRGLHANVADAAAFNEYLQLLSQHPPAATWPRAEQMAYWINAYNAYTIRLILDHYPVKSIKDIGSSIQIPFVTTPWAAKFFTIGGQKMSLDNIEHGILRKRYADPRIHFALVCAARSCPRLRNEAYAAARLDVQLDDQGRNFLNNPAKNRITPAKAQLSKYFDWYRGDWNANGQSVTQWVNRYAATKITADTPISYLDYNWQLNAQ